jgi:hypothetical protein
MTNDSLPAIRDKIKEKVTTSYIFLDTSGNPIQKNNENDYTLEKISIEKVIKLKSEGNDSGIDVFMNDSKVCSVNCSMSQNLSEVRCLISQNIKQDFFFLDTTSSEVSKSDENDYNVEDIIQDGSIKLKCLDSPPASEVSLTKGNNKTVTNNEKKNKKTPKNKINFSKYEILEKKEGLTTYKYSNVERKSDHELVYQYFFDEFDILEVSKAFVILFCGKTGDGKTTAINAFFNIVKGIELEDEQRFILITEPVKEKGQAESQTDGVHLYYLRDYENKPVIIIDSQGYGDTRGKEYDDKVDEAFRYVFSNVIDHINSAFFIVKSNTNRIDTLTKYIFSSVTNLFSDDVAENFIVLATFANKETIKKGPAFAESIQTDADFLEIQKNMNEKWWYALDSRSILDNDTDKLTIYSFEQAKDLYDEKVKKFRPKGIKKSAEVLNTRMDLRIQVENLNDTFVDLLNEQDHLQKKEKIINETSNQISMMETKISELENMMKISNPLELEKKIRELNEELNNKLCSLNTETETKQIKTLKKDSDNKYTHCDTCKKNCHDPCDCYFKSMGRCTVYKFFTKKCEICGCPKAEHSQDNYYYGYETVVTNKDNQQQKQHELEENEEKKKKILEEMNKKSKDKSNFQKQKNEIEYNKQKLIEEKGKNSKEKEEIQKRITNINKQIVFIIIKLQSISEKINNIAMNNNHIKNEDEYIDDLMEKMDKMNIKDKDKIEKMKKIKETNLVYKKTLGINRNELLNLSDEDLAKKLSIIIPSNKSGSIGKMAQDADSSKTKDKK